jgi:ABC-type lipoprotein release transport system permease subunit
VDRQKKIMTLSRLILREIGYRKLNFALGVFAAAFAVGCLVTQLTILRRHDQRTEQIIAAKQAETQERLAVLEDDYRKLTLKMGFNILILPKDQNLADLYADDFAAKTMPEEYATRLAKSRVATINHILPTLQQKVKWPERERTILLNGVRGVVYLQSAKQKPLLEPVAAGTMILGHELARNLQLKAGDETALFGRSFKVAQVNPERGNKDDITVWINLAEAQAMLNKPGQINAILALDCTCDTLDRLSRIRAEISRILPDTQVIEFASQALARAEARHRAGAEAVAALEQEKTNRANLRAEREAFAAVLVPVALLGAAVWIGFLAFSNVRERAVEIGILRALGLRSRHVLILFLSRALAIGFVGAALGFAGGVLITRPAMPALQLPWLPVVLLAAPVLAALASWLPALLAAQQDPATILSKE